MAHQEFEDEPDEDEDTVQLQVDDRCLAFFLPTDFLTSQFVCAKTMPIYYIIAFFNFFLRIAWVMSVSPNLFFSVRREYFLLALGLFEQYRYAHSRACATTRAW